MMSCALLVPDARRKPSIVGLTSRGVERRDLRVDHQPRLPLAVLRGDHRALDARQQVEEAIDLHVPQRGRDADARRRELAAPEEALRALPVVKRQDDEAVLRRADLAVLVMREDAPTARRRRGSGSPAP